MLDKKEFKDIEKDLEKFEEKREEVIARSRDIIRLSKLIIYSVHRGENANTLVKQIKEMIKKLPPEPHATGIHSIAIQEYVEAICYYEFVNNGKLPTRKALEVETNHYLLGLCDLTGELARKAVASAINQDYGMVYKIKDLVDEIYGAFSRFNLRNDELRKKSDAIKWNLKKLEDITYELKLKNL